MEVEAEKRIIMINFEENGWVIERYFNGQLCYWGGSSATDFECDNLKAIRFARLADASYVLAWLLGGHGRAVEHMWVGEDIKR